MDEAEEILKRRQHALSEVVLACNMKRAAVDVLDRGVDLNDQPYLDVTIEGHPYRLILEDHG